MNEYECVLGDMRNYFKVDNQINWVISHFIARRWIADISDSGNLSRS